MAEVVLWRQSSPIFKVDNDSENLVKEIEAEAEKRFRLASSSQSSRVQLQKKESLMTSSTPTPARIAAAEALVTLRKYEDDLPSELIHELTKAAADTDDAPDIGENVARLAKADDKIAKEAGRENLRQQVHKARQAMEARYLEQISPNAAKNAQRMREHNQGRRDW